jgi:hypothetical protein
MAEAKYTPATKLTTAAVAKRNRENGEAMGLMG